MASTFLSKGCRGEAAATVEVLCRPVVSWILSRDGHSSSHIVCSEWLGLGGSTILTLILSSFGVVEWWRMYTGN